MERFDERLVVNEDSGNKFYQVIPCEDGKFVLFADAQATIAELQARLEQVQEERSKYIQAVGLATTCAADMQIDTSHPIEMMQEVCKRFTQRTAELEAAKGKLDIILRVSRGEPDDELAVDYGGLGWENDPAVLGVYNLIAELERVRGERDRLALCGHDNSTQWWQVRYEELAALVAALPKVEGQWTVSCAMADRVVEGGIVSDISEAVAAIVKHRQGMEG